MLESVLGEGFFFCCKLLQARCDGQSAIVAMAFFSRFSSSFSNVALHCSYFDLHHLVRKCPYITRCFYQMQVMITNAGNENLSIDNGIL